MIDSADRARLLSVARVSIAHGFDAGAPLAVDANAESPALRVRQGAFVTLHRGDELRGCVGSLEASAPLVESVARSAFRAAFLDARFPPLERDELAATSISISVLEPAHPLPVASEAELARTLRPGTDGLTLRVGSRRATFLPSVWEQIESTGEFIRRLKRKAGIPETAWPEGIAFETYGAESFGEQ